MNKFTPEDLVQYLYNETSVQKKAAIEAELERDWNLRDAYEQLLDAHKNLDEIQLSPRDESVNRVLQYASKKASQLHHQ